jgi:hypothetical protein
MLIARSPVCPKSEHQYWPLTSTPILSITSSSLSPRLAAALITLYMPPPLR